MPEERFVSVAVEEAPERIVTLLDAEPPAPSRVSITKEAGEDWVTAALRQLADVAPGARFVPRDGGGFPRAVLNRPPKWMTAQEPIGGGMVRYTSIEAPPPCWTAEEAGRIFQALATRDTS